MLSLAVIVTGVVVEVYLARVLGLNPRHQSEGIPPNVIIVTGTMVVMG